MLAVRPDHRKQGIGRQLVGRAIEAIMQAGADEIVLETELSNVGALALYEGLGFHRDKRLEKYYLNGSDAFRLKLILQTGNFSAPNGSNNDETTTNVSVA